MSLPTTEEAPWSLPVPGQESNVTFSYPNTPAPMAPPHHQPMSEVHNADLGFTTLEDWFNGSDGDLFGGLDLQDFWLQVGPGEVSQAMDVSNCRHKAGFLLDSSCISLAFAKDPCADAHAVAPFLDRLHKVCTHAHA